MLWLVQTCLSGLHRQALQTLFANQSEDMVLLRATIAGPVEVFLAGLVFSALSSGG